MRLAELMAQYLPELVANRIDGLRAEGTQHHGSCPDTAIAVATSAIGADAEREAIEERAAILEYDGHLTRLEAEAKATRLAADSSGGQGHGAEVDK